MKIAIASGKGGTGKTTVATNLAMVAGRQGLKVAYLDCDVEEPNGHLFLKPSIRRAQTVNKPVPRVDQDRCTRCGKCAEICQYGAIASLPNKTMIFDELCHACGGCHLVCPLQAITEYERPIGELRHGEIETIQFVDGKLNIGEAMSPPLISAVKHAAAPADLTIIDSPPGTSCPVIESLRGVDFAILVTEPTPFGLYDLKLAVEMIRALRIPHAVVINRSVCQDGPVHEYCAQEEIEIITELPDDRAVAETYSRGEMICDFINDFRERIQSLLEAITTSVTDIKGVVR